MQARFLLLCLLLLLSPSPQAWGDEPPLQKPYRGGSVLLGATVGMGGQVVKDDAKEIDPGPLLGAEAHYLFFPYFSAGLSVTNSFLAISHSSLNLNLLMVNGVLKGYLPLGSRVVTSLGIEVGHIYQVVYANGESASENGVNFGVNLGVEYKVFSHLFVGVGGGYQIPRWPETCTYITQVEVECHTPKVHSWWLGARLFYYFEL